MSLARDITTVGGGTLLSRLLAFIRDAWIAALLGTGAVAEAFFVVLQVINFFRRLLADGALNGAFVPIYAALRSSDDGEANANRFTRRSLLVMFCIGGIVALLAIVFGRHAITVVAPGFDVSRRNFSAFLLFFAAPYIAFAGVIAVIAAALSAETRVAAVAISMIAFNIVMLLALYLLPTEGIEPYYAAAWIAVAVTAAGLAQLAITATAWLSSGKRFRRAVYRVPDQTRQLFRRAIPGLIAAGVPQLKLIAAAAIVSSSHAGVSWLYYANRLYELPLGVASIAIAAVIVPRLAAAMNAGGDMRAHEQSRAFELTLGLALPAAAGFALLAQPIAGGLFERGAFTARDTHAVAAALTAICAGLPGHVLEKMFGAVSFVNNDTRTPMLTALCGLAVAIAGGLILFPLYGYVGAAAAIAVSGWVGATLLGLILRRRGWLSFDEGAATRLVRIVIATTVMAAAVWLGLTAVLAAFPGEAHTLVGRSATLAMLVTLGLAIYGAALHLLGVTRIGEVAAALRVRS
jgi:putative peptidoglycan lipid II flippase